MELRGNFATLGESFVSVTLRDGFSVLMSRSHNTSGGVCMSIEAVLLIVVLTFGIGFVLNRWDTGRIRPRRGVDPRDRILGRRRVI
jgi:hypothetical protein